MDIASELRSQLCELQSSVKTIHQDNAYLRQCLSNQDYKLDTIFKLLNNFGNEIGPILRDYRNQIIPDNLEKQDSAPTITERRNDKKSNHLATCYSSPGLVLTDTGLGVLDSNEPICPRSASQAELSVETIVVPTKRNRSSSFRHSRDVGSRPRIRSRSIDVTTIHTNAAENKQYTLKELLRGGVLRDELNSDTYTGTKDFDSHRVVREQPRDEGNKGKNHDGENSKTYLDSCFEIEATILPWKENNLETSSKPLNAIHCGAIDATITPKKIPPSAVESSQTYFGHNLIDKKSVEEDDLKHAIANGTDHANIMSETTVQLIVESNTESNMSGTTENKPTTTEGCKHSNTLNNSILISENKSQVLTQEETSTTFGSVETSDGNESTSDTRVVSNPSFAKQRVYSCGSMESSLKESDNGILKIMKRQLSTSSTNSTNSAPGGIHMKIGTSESEEDDEEFDIKVPEMPRPAFIHRVVQLKQFDSKYFYELKQSIGGGRFGRVYRCVEKKSGVQLAAKCFKCKKPHETTALRSLSLKRPINVTTKRTQQEPVDKEDVRDEITILNNIDHDNIIKLYDAFEYENTMTLIMEYMDGGELFERVLADRSQLTELDAILYMRQICKAMQYLHKNLILHLDLKPENILCLDRKSHHVKIIDFGLARKYNPRQKLMVHWGTPEFMAPEVLNYEIVSAASDMWSVGVICYILVSGVSPFLGNDDKGTIQNIIDAEWEFDDETFDAVSDEAKDFMSRLLVEEKSGRMSSAQCLRHDWLATPLTSHRMRCLQSKKKLKKFMARMHWKAGVAAVSAANWLFSKNHACEASNQDGTKV